MKAIGKYVRECCGKRLPAKYKFCPVCGVEANRPAQDRASAILIEIDKRARGCEGNAAKMLERLRKIDAGTLAPADFGYGGEKIDLSFHRQQAEKSMASYIRSGLWYRSVERLITDLATGQTLPDKPTPPEAST